MFPTYNQATQLTARRCFHKVSNVHLRFARTDKGFKENLMFSGLLDKHGQYLHSPRPGNYFRTSTFSFMGISTSSHGYYGYAPSITSISPFN
ncbi:MAG TPA: hypothetical protein ACFCUD_11045 [Cyclobacteriaceae bacterium]